jgi:hypothetical protein
MQTDAFCVGPGDAVATRVALDHRRVLFDEQVVLTPRDQDVGFEFTPMIESGRRGHGDLLRGSA